MKENIDINNELTSIKQELTEIKEKSDTRLEKISKL